MIVVVDANIVISLLITPSNSIDLFFAENVNLIAPEFILQEIDKHKKDTLRKSGLNEDEFDRFFNIIRKRIQTHPESTLLQYTQLALKVCPDRGDVSYFALAFKMGCPIWSNDKKLKEQEHIIVYNTQEFSLAMNAQGKKG